MAEVKTIVTYLEMTAEPFLQILPPSKIKLMLLRAEDPAVGFYRYLYTAVGRSFHWADRNRLSDADLAAIVQNEKIEIWVAYANGQPAGYFEIDARREPAEVELEYHGVLPEFQRLGLGKWLLAEAIRACWARKPERVIVQTCTLDDPTAFPLYQMMGFVPYGREEKMVETSD